MARAIFDPFSSDFEVSPAIEMACCAMETPYLELSARVKSFMTAPRSSLTVPLNNRRPTRPMRADCLTRPVASLFNTTVERWFSAAQFL